MVSKRAASMVSYSADPRVDLKVGSAADPMAVQWVLQLAAMMEMKLVDMKV